MFLGQKNLLKIVRYLKIFLLFFLEELGEKLEKLSNRKQTRGDFFLVYCYKKE